MAPAVPSRVLSILVPAPRVGARDSCPTGSYSLHKGSIEENAPPVLSFVSSFVPFVPLW